MITKILCGLAALGVIILFVAIAIAVTLVVAINVMEEMQNRSLGD